MSQNAYVTLMRRQRKEVSDFPIIFAFNEQQLVEGMQKFGLHRNQQDQLLSLGMGGFIRKSDKAGYTNMAVRHEKEMLEAMRSDVKGDGFIFDMFCYELANHEYGYTGSISDTLDALGLTYQDIESKPALRNGLELAMKKVRSEN